MRITPQAPSPNPSGIATGGPAFPNERNYQSGMSLRDFFAAQALIGFCATSPKPPKWDEEDVAHDCYVMADALLKAREAQS